MSDKVRIFKDGVLVMECEVWEPISHPDIPDVVARSIMSKMEAGVREHDFPDSLPLFDPFSFEVIDGDE